MKTEKMNETSWMSATRTCVSGKCSGVRVLDRTTLRKYVRATKCAFFIRLLETFVAILNQSMSSDLHFLFLDRTSQDGVPNLLPFSKISTPESSL